MEEVEDEDDIQQAHNGNHPRNSRTLIEAADGSDDDIDMLNGRESDAEKSHGNISDEEDEEFDLPDETEEDELSMSYSF